MNDIKVSKIAILDFRTGIVYVRDIPEKMRGFESEDILDYFCGKLGIESAEDTQYMTGDLLVNIK